VPVARNGN